MTLSTTLASVVYTGNSGTTDFPFSFTVLDEADLEVYLWEIATGTRTLLATSAYTVTGVPGAGSISYNPSGVPLPATYKIVLQRVVDLTQDMDIENQGGFLPTVLENQLDLIVMQTQQLQAQLDRAIMADVGGTGLTTDDIVEQVADALTAADQAVASAAAAAASAALAAAEVDGWEALTIGTVTTLVAGSSATVINVGTPPNVTLNFGIPRGPAGAAGAGSGDVIGPATSTNNGFAKFDGTTGDLLKDSAAVIAIADGGTGASTAPNAFTALKQAATTTATGVVELLTDAEAQTGTDTTRAMTAANLQAVTATEARKGVVELATNAEAVTGTDTARATTPAGVAAAIAAVGTPNYATGNAALAAGGVGTYVFGDRDSNSAVFGSTYAGSGIYPSGYGESAGELNSQSSALALSGTWRAMGNTSSGSNRTTLFLRIV